jgi:hypothetical protein
MVDNLTSAVFRALYKGYELITIGSTYIVYPPPVLGGPLMYISDSLGAIARQISEAETFDVELYDLTEDGTDPLPHRPK